MYPTVLIVHSLLRWVVLLTGVLAFARALGGRRSTRAWSAADSRAGLWFTLALDIQFLLGLLLYAVLSPVTRTAFASPGAAMGNTVLRFWFVEHPFGMLVALALVHVGRVRIRKAADDRRRHRTATVFFGVALAIILLSLPWPGMASARPLLRGW